MMGCVSSKPDINDQHPNIFQVTNVNEQRELLNPGQLEVTETELVLYQRGKEATIWPLRALRKYGFDSEIFSFECGRRCPTGEGVYAFHCRKAEHLFNIVQQHIVRNGAHDDPHPLQFADFPFPLATTGPPVQRRDAPPPAASRPASAASAGPASPDLAPLAPPEHNNNKRASVAHAYCNTAPLDGDAAPALPPEEGAFAHLYMNVDAKEARGEAAGDEEGVGRHCYANIELEQMSVPATPTALYITVTEVNYTELDFDPSMKNEGVSCGGGESPGKGEKGGKKSYATIDFKKTNALSHSINPPIEVEEEGSRKTRHNSTIGDITTRHSNSLSD